MIEIRDISKKYRETFVLRHVSTRLPSDRMVAFIGSNGAGKSTMLNNAACPPGNFGICSTT